VYCIREINHMPDLTRFLKCSLDLNMGTIWSTTHIKVIFSISPNNGKYFTGNALSSSDNFVMQLIHILHFFTINCVLQTHRRKSQRSQIWRMRVPRNGPPCSYPTVMKLPVQKGTDMLGEVRWCTI
jgi:hypothetical protein